MLEVNEIKEDGERPGGDVSSLIDAREHDEVGSPAAPIKTVLVVDAAALEKRRGSVEDEAEGTLPREKEERRASHEERDLVVVELEPGTEAHARAPSGESPR